MPTGGAKIRRWTLRENRSRYETEAHAFRRWVLSRCSHDRPIAAFQFELKTEFWLAALTFMARLPRFMGAPQAIIYKF